MHFYAITRDINRAPVVSNSEKWKCDDDVIRFIVDNMDYREHEIGYANSLDEAISIMSEDADYLKQKFNVPKAALLYKIAKRKLGRINAMDRYGNWSKECRTDDGVSYIIFEPGKAKYVKYHYKEAD